MTTVLVSWGCALWSPLTQTASMPARELSATRDSVLSPTTAEIAAFRLDAIPKQLHPSVASSGSYEYAVANRDWGRGVHVASIQHGVRAMNGDVVHELTVLECGWPWRSMRAHRCDLNCWSSNSTGGLAAEDSPFPTGLPRLNGPYGWRSGVGVPRFARARPLGHAQWGIPAVLPLRPIEIGFAANTLFWSVVIAFAAWCIPETRRARWKRRGLCLGCGYDVASLAACPECGAPRDEIRADTPIK